MQVDEGKQAVADDETDVFTPDEDEDARDDGQDDDLESALEQIESKTQTKADTPAPKKDDTDLQARLARLEKERDEDRQRAARQDVESALDQTVNSFLDNDTIKQVYDQDEVRGLIEVEAQKDDRLMDAFINRHSDKAGWKRVSAGLMKKIETKAASKVSQNRSEQEAATASAQGVSTSAPSANDELPPQHELAGKSDAELDALKRQLDPEYGA